MRIKNPNHSASGFTLIEVMVAVFIIGSVLTAIFTLQNQTFLSVQRNTQRLLHQLQLTNSLAYAEGERMRGVPPQEVKLADQKMNTPGVTYALEKPKEGSILTRFEGIKLERVSIASNKGQKGAEQQMIRLVFAPEPPPEEKA